VGGLLAFRETVGERVNTPGIGGNATQLDAAEGDFLGDDVILNIDIPDARMDGRLGWELLARSLMAL
jgi:hypothetical protein